MRPDGTTYVIGTRLAQPFQKVDFAWYFLQPATSIHYAFILTTICRRLAEGLSHTEMAEGFYMRLAKRSDGTAVAVPSELAGFPSQQFQVFHDDRESGQ